MKERMFVYEKYRDNGDPWKIWCISTDKKVTVKWGASDARLQERTLNITVNEAQDRINQKLREGYVYQGDFMVDDRVHERVDVKPAPAPVNQPLIKNELVSWRSSGKPADNWVEDTVNLLKPLVEVIAKEASDEVLLLAPSIEFRFKMDRLGNSRGHITESKFDAISMVTLLAIARFAQTLTIVDDDGSKISTSKFREGMKHLKFESSSFQDFEEMMKEVGLIRTGSGVVMRGATAFL
jgi:hypothetical protein